MINWLLGHAELVALTVNITMFLAFLLRGDMAKATYWGGTVLVVLGLLKMRG